MYFCLAHGCIADVAAYGLKNVSIMLLSVVYIFKYTILYAPTNILTFPSDTLRLKSSWRTASSNNESLSQKVSGIKMQVAIFTKTRTLVVTLDKATVSFYIKLTNLCHMDKIQIIVFWNITPCLNQIVKKCMTLRWALLPYFVHRIYTYNKLYILQMLQEVLSEIHRRFIYMYNI